MSPDSWAHLQRWTAARIALGRAGFSLPTDALLSFQWDHARARDAIFQPCEFAGLETEAQRWELSVIRVRSRAMDRATYLRHPDWGRQLSDDSLPLFDPWPQGWNVVIVVGDGLSALAVDRQAAGVLHELVPRLISAGFSVGPLVLAEMARVALADPIGERLKADLTIHLIGERPGLSAPDSLGAYLTWAPRTGRQNAERNCISNIRPEGLSAAAAAETLVALARGARLLEESGIGLKEDSWLTSS